MKSLGAIGIDLSSCGWKKAFNKYLARINELSEAGQLKPVIDGPYPLREAPQAVQYFGEGKHQGKVVIAVAGA